MKRTTSRERFDELRRRLARHPFDYVIGSVHFVDGFPLDSRAADWEALAPAARDDQWRLYWRRLRRLAESGVFDFAAHLDLPKKFGFRPQADLTAAADDALAAIVAGTWDRDQYRRLEPPRGGGLSVT